MSDGGRREQQAARVQLWAAALPCPHALQWSAARPQATRRAALGQLAYAAVRMYAPIR
jgi:hypothetical protein